MARWVWLLLMLIADVCAADVFRPAYLELTELEGDRYDVLWKVPSISESRRLAAYVKFPQGTEVLTEASVVRSEGAWVERWKVWRAGGLVNQEIRIEGSAAGTTDVIARVQRADGSAQVARLAISDPKFVVEPPTGTGEVAWSYLVLGIEHILMGIDHLLFVVALLLIVGGGRRLLLTITAFTVAHSVTLAAATFGWIQVPGPPVEAIIAMSIVFVAAEAINVRRGYPAITVRKPWLVAFSFGLLHGLGFAGALAEIGLPAVAIPTALLMFNVGVELGQVLFVAAILTGKAALRSLINVQHAAYPVATAYGVGTIAAFWTIERVLSFWP